MHIYGLERRQQQQQPAPSGGGMDSENTRDTTLPTYTWIVVVLLIFLAVTCGVCARRRHQRQFLQREAVISSHRPTLSFGRNPYAPPWGAFSRPSAETVLQPPPRARRRPSQASITSLPVYMENPGAREVVLLQRTAPKDMGDSDSPTQQTTADPAVINIQENDPAQLAPTYSPTTRVVDNGATSLPGYEPSATLASSPPADSSLTVPQPAHHSQ